MRRALIQGFVIFHLISVICWCLPVGNPLVVTWKDWIRPYFVWSGLFQSWDMFSPAPRAINGYVEAIVLYRDGHTRTWGFPRMEQLSLRDRYLKERFRKYGEYLGDEKYAALWPDAARYVARANNNGPAPVKTILFVRYWSEIMRQADGAFVSAPWDAHVFYSYVVRAEDLK